MTTFAEIQARLRAVLCDGWGTDGLLGVAAQARALEAGRFRWSTVPLDDAVAASAFHRAVFVDWTEERDHLTDDNEQHSSALRVVTVVVQLGYLHSSTLANLGHTVTGEDVTAVVAEGSMHAIGDSHDIRRALCFPQLTMSAPALTPELVNVSRVGGATTRDLGGGRRLLSQTFELTVFV